MVKMVHCPQCNKLVPWQDDQKWKPFCSDRCKLIDLGDWASENHRIADNTTQSEQYDLDIDSFNPSDYH
ncbi:MAG: DNA gyrase inhibitor YacG [Piscirickettsiaceae bacterium]|nr:DNA gyrase inhibitor YacG [Piscirickettsiaceae bacterium]